MLLNDPNITAPGDQSNLTKTCADYNYLQFAQSMYSGEGDVDKVRYYNTIWGYDYITMNFSWWDGNKTILATVTPWNG